jgi:hypothetical protein
MPSLAMLVLGHIGSNAGRDGFAWATERLVRTADVESASATAPTKVWALHMQRYADPWRGE